MSDRLNIVGLLLRGSSMLGKFLLILLLSKQGTLTDLGIYGLFITTVVLVNYAQGIEFHSFAGRELICGAESNRASIIGNQTLVYLITYALLLPLVLLVFVGQVLSWELVYLFYWIVVVTHLGQETHRALIVLSQLKRAYFVSFLMHGLWAIVAVVFMFFSLHFAGLKFIFILWGCSASLGLIVGVVFLKKEQCIHSGMFKFDRVWVMNGLQVCYKFFIAALAFKSIELSDRYFIQYYFDNSAVGVYTLFSSIAAISQEIIFTGIVVVIYPAMVSSFRKGDLANYQASYRRLKTRVSVGSALLGLVILIAAHYLFSYLEKPEFDQNFLTFIILLFAGVIVNLSLVPHYALYARAKDSSLMWAVLFGAVVNLVLNYLLIPSYGMLGAAWATLVAVSLVFTIKAVAMKNLTEVGVHE